MGWVTLISSLLSIFGPAIAKWMEKCMEERLKNAAKKLPKADTFASEGVAAAALIDQAIADLPWWAKSRKRAFEKMKKVAVVGGELRTKPLTASEKKEAKVLVGGIEPQ